MPAYEEFNKQYERLLEPVKFSSEHRYLILITLDSPWNYKNGSFVKRSDPNFSYRTHELINYINRVGIELNDDVMFEGHLTDDITRLFGWKNELNKFFYMIYCHDESAMISLRMEGHRVYDLRDSEFKKKFFDLQVEDARRRIFPKG